VNSLHQRQAGAGLVEIMIALVLGLVLITGVFQVYLGSKRNYEVQESLQGRQAAARFTLSMLTEELQMAGYRGCVRDVGLVRNTLNNPDGFLFDFGRHVEGFRGLADGTWSPALPAGFSNLVANNDVLTVRAADDTGATITQSMPTPSAALKVDDNLNPPPVAIGDIAMITDCGGAAIFQVTNYTVANGNIVHNAGVGGGLPSPGNATSNLGRRYAEGAQLFRMRTTSYYIAPSSNGTGPALWRRSSNRPAEELAEGVERLRIRYGEDLDGDGVPDAWRRADQVGFWERVTALRVAILVSSTRGALVEEDDRTFLLFDEEAGPFTDGRLRQVMTTTISLRNRLP